LYYKNEEVVCTRCTGKPEFSSALKIPNDLKDQTVRGVNLYIESHRGCTANCVFCAIPRLFGNNIRKKPIELILEEVRKLKQAGVEKLALSGGTSAHYGLEFETLLSSISQIMGKENFAAPDLRVDCATERVLSAVKKHTVGWVAYGIESGSQRILDKMGKGTRIEQVRKAVELTKQLGLQVVGSFITSFPGETEEDHKATVDLISELKLDDAFSGIVLPIPGTSSFLECLNNPLVFNKTAGRRLNELILLNMEITNKMDKELAQKMTEEQVKDIQALFQNLKPFIKQNSGEN